MINEEDYIEDEIKIDPDCPKVTDDEEIDCEFERQGKEWWCITHDCYA